MRQLLVLMLLAGLAWPAICAPSNWGVLLEPNQLATILASNGDVRVIQVTGDYDKGHIPGAIWAPYAQFRGSGDNSGTLVSLKVLTEILQGLGINANSPVVVVHSGESSADFGAAARVYWTLKSLGVNTLALLNGGLAAWSAANQTISRKAGWVVPSDFEPSWHDDWRATTQEIEQFVTNKSARLVDARPPDYFRGLRASSARPGTIKSAINLPFNNFFLGSRLKSPSQAGQIMASKFQLDATTTVSFCNTGHLAAINWFIISELLRVPGAKLYAESMTEWTLAARPLDNEPMKLRTAD